MAEKTIRDLAETCWKYLSSCWSTLYLLPGTCFPYPEVAFDNRRFKILKLLGEGGYSFIYLVKELPTPEQPFVVERYYALKKLNLASDEQVRLAETEIEVLREVKHPHIIKLLSSSIHRSSNEDQGLSGYLLFSWYQEGSVVELVSRLYEKGCRLSPFSVLDIFRQICEAVEHLHEMGYCHRDIKPHNILIERRDRSEINDLTEDPRTSILSPITELSDEDIEASEWSRENSYNAVLTDFGSVGPSQIIVETRQEGLKLQEDMSVLSSMPYRAPELFDVPSPTVIDEKIDTWSLGCTLYFLMYGTSPFEKVLAESGGSIALAIANGRIQWPKPPTRHYPEEIHSLVVACLDTNPQTRPLTSELVVRIKSILSGDLQTTNNV